MGARKFTGRKATAAASAVAAAGAAALWLAVPAASASTSSVNQCPGTTTYYTKADVNGAAWQYDTDNVLTKGDANTYSNSPVDNNDGFEFLSGQGANLSNSDPNGDSGVVVPLGHLSSLFNGSDQYVGPTVVGSGLEGSFNLYIDTNGDNTYFGFTPPGPYVDTGGNLNGDTKVSIPFSATPTTTVHILGGYTNEGTVLSQNTPYTLEQIQQAYKKNTVGAPTDPLIWAWMGVGDTGAAGTQTGYVTSVDGQDLVVTNTITVTDPGKQVSTVGSPVSLQIKATDTNGKPLTYSLSGSLLTDEPGLKIGASTGLITGTPGKVENSDSAIVAVSDGTGTTETCFSWVVSAAPAPSPSHGPYPLGGVETGGGKPVTSPWLPLVVSLSALGALMLAGAGLALRRQRG